MAYGYVVPKPKVAGFRFEESQANESYKNKNRIRPPRVLRRVGRPV
jgi:hypothetical protein